jgi:TatD DNase family protein
MRLFDTHTHLQAPEFDDDRDAVLLRAREAGVVGLLVLGWAVASSEAAIALAEAEDDVVAASGCHPHDARTMDDPSWERLTELAHHPNVAVVGEIGLDFYRNLSPRDTQIEVFRRQLELATEVAKPAAVHCREAHEALLPLVEAWSRRQGGRLPDGRPLGVMHYFSGDAELAERYVELGFLCSVHCSVTYPKARPTQEVARRLSVDALVVETDSPYGPPQSRRGERNEPAYISEAVAKVAALRGEPAERIAEVTTENAVRLFALGAGTATASGMTTPRGV